VAVDGPATLMDSAEAGSELNSSIPAAGCPRRHRFRCPPAAGGPSHPYKADEENWVGLVQILPVES